MSPTIGDVARQAGVSADTLRFYEREGILPTPARGANGYRQYTEETVERVRLIKGAQRVGLRLSEIKELLAARDRGLCPCGHTESMIRAHLVEVEREMARLGHVKSELERMLGPHPRRERRFLD